MFPPTDTRTCVATGVVRPFGSLEELRTKTGTTTKTVKASDMTGSVHGGYTYSFKCT
jgi:hypothetical protein